MATTDTYPGKSERAERIQVYAAVAQCILAAATLIGTIAVALFVWRSQAVMTSRQINKSSRDSWIAIDLAALSNDQLLVSADTLLAPETVNQSLDRRRRRWVAYAVMNILIERYDAAQEGLIGPKEEVIASTREMLRILVADDDVFELTQRSGYESHHMALCRSVHEELLRERAKQSPAVNGP